MTDQTTIRISKSTKAALDEHKQDGESYDDTVARLAGKTPEQIWTQEEIEQIADERARQVFEQLARQ